jgi:hypothetical protein
MAFRLLVVNDGLVVGGHELSDGVEIVPIVLGVSPVVGRGNSTNGFRRELCRMAALVLCTVAAGFLGYTTSGLIQGGTTAHNGPLRVPASVFDSIEIPRLVSLHRRDWKYGKVREVRFRLVAVVSR